MRASLSPLLRHTRSLLSAARASSLASCVTHAAADSTALIAPAQGVHYSYAELDHSARCLASGLHELGYREGSVMLSNVPNVTQSIILQIALSHLGATLATPLGAEQRAALASTHHVAGALVCEPAQAELEWASDLPLRTISLAPPSETSPLIHFDEICDRPPRVEDPAANEATLLGVFGSAKLSNSMALQLGAAAASRLRTEASDRTCVSISLVHAFGIGSAVCNAFVSNAAVVLPAVGGIKGCGDPKQRADVTLSVLESTGSTQLFADTHTLRAMPSMDSGALPKLRAGVVKIGSGSDFLEGVREVPTPGGQPLPLEYAGVRMIAMGKKS